MPGDPRTRDELIDAMSQRACPVCVVVARAERKAVDHLLYDQVNDISRRDALRASRGYCLYHTDMLSEGRSALGIAIISRDILRAMTAELEAAGTGQDTSGSQILERFVPGTARTGARLATKIEPQAQCPMCAARPQIEEPLIIGLLRNLDDDAFAAAFAASEGLCRRHLANTLRAANSATAHQLATLQAACWRDVEATLDEFIRKHDYRFNEEVAENERDIWLRALRLSSGWFQ